MRHVDGHVVGESAHHQPHVNQKMSSPSLEHHPHAPARNDFVGEVIAEGALHLLLQTSLEGLKEPLGKSVPGCSLEGLGFGPDDVIPNVRNQEQVSIVLLCKEGQHLRTCGIFWQRLEEFQRRLRSPVEAEDFRKVAL